MDWYPALLLLPSSVLPFWHSLKPPLYHILISFLSFYPTARAKIGAAYDDSLCFYSCAFFFTYSSKGLEIAVPSSRGLFLLFCSTAFCNNFFTKRSIPSKSPEKNCFSTVWNLQTCAFGLRFGLSTSICQIICLRVDIWGLRVRIGCLRICERLDSVEDYYQNDAFGTNEGFAKYGAFYLASQPFCNTALLHDTIQIKERVLLSSPLFTSLYSWTSREEYRICPNQLERSSQFRKLPFS